MTVYADTHHNDELLRAWAYLSAVAEPPCSSIRRLVNDIGAVSYTHLTLPTNREV